MKRLTFFLLSLLVVFGPQVLAQSYNRNFVLTRTFINNQGTSFMDHCQYYDDLGRDDQWVQMRVTPEGKDVYSAVQYDSVGRQWRESIPVVSNNSNGSYLADIFNRAQLSRGDKCPFLETGYEASPMSRILTKTGPGVEWHDADKRARVSWFVNDSDINGIFYAWCFDVNSNYDFHFASPSIYREGELYVELTTDEDNDSTLTFKNKQNQTLLIRQRNQGVSHDTYYVYNDYGLLCYVLPPMMEGRVDAETLSLYAYSYKYDYRNRCIEKKLPGCEPIYMVYDRSDRVVLQQNGVQRDNHRWIVNKYGHLGQLVYSFEHTDTTPVDTLRAQFKDLLVYESRPSLSSELDPFGIGYTDNYCSWGSDRRLLIVNYYDDYAYLNQVDSNLKSALSFISRSGFEEQPGNTSGLLTGSRQCLLDNSGKYIFSAYYYDKQGRMVQKHSMNSCGGYDHEYDAYTFTDNPLVHFHCHTDSLSAAELTEEYIYEYDHANRPTITNYSLNGSKSIILSKNIYNEYGQLQKKVFHDFLYASTYEYNIRNWLTSLSGKHFNQRLYYQDGSGTPYYNGNISSMKWTVGSDTVERGYQFAYDGMKRLTNAVYGEGNDLELNLNRFNEQVTDYDKMGNILGLKRYGQTSANSYNVIDDLSLTYDGNHLKKVTDSSINQAFNGGFEFKDGANTATEYEYDKNGNLTKDLNKKIADIQYNYLNLPVLIQFEDGNRISFVYDANGTKLRTTHLIDGVTTTTDYCGNVIYENGVAKTLLTEVGYVSLDDKKYHYFVQDHQGNNRVVIDQNGAVEEVNHYYPFGGTFANSQSVQPYKYNGKELDRKGRLDWYDYGARHYDAALGRWHSIDPLVEKYYGLSPYSYCGSNSINRIDYNGCDWYQSTNQDEYIWREGHKDIDGYIRLGSSMSFQIGEDSFLNFYQNAGIKANQAANAFDLIFSSGKLQNQLLGKNSPLSDNSKSALFNGLNSRAMDEFARPIGESLVENGVGVLIGGALGKAAGHVLRKTVAKTAKGAVMTGESFFDGAKYSTKVLSQMDKADDIFHAFPKSVDGYAAKFGQYSIKVGADGKVYQWLKVPGSYGSRSGVFEYIKDANGLINHRFFNVP